MGISEFLVMELTLLGGGGSRKWWFVRTIVASILLIISGLSLLLLMGRLALAHVSLVGMWYIISALMVSAHLRAKETGIIEVILQRMGGTYLTMNYAIYFAASLIASLMTVAFLFISLGMEAEPSDIFFLLSMCFLGSVMFTTTTMILIVAVGGRRILDAFSYLMGGLLLIMLIVPFFLLDSFASSSLIVTVGGSAIFIIIMTKFLIRADRSKLIEI